MWDCGIAILVGLASAVFVWWLLSPHNKPVSKEDFDQRIWDRSTWRNN